MEAFNNLFAEFVAQLRESYPKNTAKLPANLNPVQQFVTYILPRIEPYACGDVTFFTAHKSIQMFEGVLAYKILSKATPQLQDAIYRYIRDLYVLGIENTLFDRPAKKIKDDLIVDRMMALDQSAVITRSFAKLLDGVNEESDEEDALDSDPEAAKNGLLEQLAGLFGGKLPDFGELLSKLGLPADAGGPAGAAGAAGAADGTAPDFTEMFKDSPIAPIMAEIIGEIGPEERDELETMGRDILSNPAKLAKSFQAIFSNPPTADGTPPAVFESPRMQQFMNKVFAKINAKIASGELNMAVLLQTMAKLMKR